MSDQFLEAEWISGHISIEGSTVHQTHNQSVRHSVLKQVGDVKADQVALHAEGTDFTADGWGRQPFLLHCVFWKTNPCTRRHSNAVDTDETVVSHRLPSICRLEPPHSKTGSG